MSEDSLNQPPPEQPRGPAWQQLSNEAKMLLNDPYGFIPASQQDVEALGSSNPDDSVERMAYKVGRLEWEKLEADAAKRMLEGEIKEVSHLAEYDDLTGLLNRRGFNERMKEWLSDASNGSLGLLYLDLDGFKAVNDRMGHELGDKFLVDFSTWLKAKLRQDGKRLDDIISHQPEIGRDGGDEFIIGVLLESTEDEDYDLSPSERLDTLTDRLRADFHLFLKQHPSYQRVGVGLSIGAAIYEAGMTLGELRRIADSEMYDEKHNKKRVQH